MPLPGVVELMTRQRGRRPMEELLDTIGNYWSSEDPWRPGLDIEFKNSGRKRVERVRCWHIDGPTWLDSLIILADEAVTASQKFLDAQVNDRVDYEP